ncbi:Foldase protein PrsA precursor (EC @ Foldase clustered with pyrimidine conversion [Olavius sp. associated proteobacterium Delta 1]|nr:Foldase protein PrsA precursor (EC @ Foldase clustered with pyrimidine conversion [Olavius sp. associated proteobacterium Delta 1]
MKKQIISFIDELKSNKKLATFDEASTKQAVVLRLLSFFGWDIFNVEEVYPDFSTNSSNVSYALRIRNSSKVFIEVKRVHKKLDSYQKDLVNIASRDGVNLAILTNGITWWFYLVSASGSWKQKWFHSVDLLKQKPEIFVPNLIDLLSKDKIAKGQSLRAAKGLFQKKRQKLAADFLPEAWNQIITQPNKIFVELLSEQTEKLCRYKLDAKTVEKFLLKHQDKWQLKNKGSSVAAPPASAMERDILDLHDELPKRPIKSLSGTDTSLSSTDTSLSSTDTSLSSTDTIKPVKSYMEKSIKAFSFHGNTYKVQTWVEMLTTLSDYFASTNKKDFEKVLWISNDQKARYSRYGDQLRIPEKVKRTDIYVETKLNPDEVVRTSCQLLAEFGYGKDDLYIEAS